MGRTHEAPDAETVLAHLLARHSIGPKHLAAPGPGHDELLMAARAAMRAPDHERLAPLRFVVVPDERRAELGELFERFARESGKSDEEARAEGGRAWNGPTLLALAARIEADHPLVPPHEQWIAAGGAIANFMNALHLMGYGAKVLSGRKVTDPAIVAALCEPGETLVGWIVAGTPRAAAKARGEDDPARILRVWK